jgi:hypothetical protein
MGLYRFSWKGRHWYTYYNDKQVKKILQIFSFLRSQEKQQCLKGKLKKEVKFGDGLLTDCLCQGYINMKPYLVKIIPGRPRNPVVKVISINERGYIRFHKELEETIYFKAHKEEILANRKPAQEKFYEDAITKSAAKLEGKEEDDDLDDEDEEVDTVSEEP